MAEPSAEAVSRRPRECAQSNDVTAAECAVSVGGGAGWRRVGSRSSVTSPAALPTARRVASGQGGLGLKLGSGIELGLGTEIELGLGLGLGLGLELELGLANLARSAPR